MKSIASDVAKELMGMFLADARLTISILILVAIAASFIDWFGVNPVVAGGILLFGSLVILVEAAMREAKERNAQ
jgi:hypothetical protein